MTRCRPPRLGRAVIPAGAGRVRAVESGAQSTVKGTVVTVPLTVTAGVRPW
jgi:hypothetical protein